MWSPPVNTVGWTGPALRSSNQITWQGPVNTTHRTTQYTDQYQCWVWREATRRSSWWSWWRWYLQWNGSQFRHTGHSQAAGTTQGGHVTQTALGFHQISNLSNKIISSQGLERTPLCWLLAVCWLWYISIIFQLTDQISFCQSYDGEETCDTSREESRWEIWLGYSSFYTQLNTQHWAGREQLGLVSSSYHYHHLLLWSRFDNRKQNIPIYQEWSEVEYFFPLHLYI